MAYIYNMVDTWNASGTTYTGIGLNVTDTASASGSLLMDLQVGGVSQFNLNKSGVTSFAAGSKTAPTVTFTGLSGGLYGRVSGVTSFSNGSVEMANIGASTGAAFNAQINLAAAGNDWSTTGGDLILSRRAAANLRFGAADAAAPVAQTLSVQSVVAGTTDTAGANLTITGSQGTGTGIGGDIVFQVSPKAASTASTQNALATALRIYNTKTVAVGAAYTVGTLPAAGTQGRRAWVTDATVPTFLGILTGGGAVVCPVFDNGTAWVSA